MPELDLRTKCDRCGHTWSFHGKSFDRECRAMGCRGGEHDVRCPAFIQVLDPVEPALSAPKE